MYNFEEFVTRVKNELENTLKSRYKNVRVGIVTSQKINCEMVGLTCDILHDSKVVPTIYMESLYNLYLEHGEMEPVLARTTEIAEEILAECPNIRNKINGFEGAEEQIVFQLIHTEQNKEFLETLPHREFLDMSIIYRWIIDVGEDGILSTPINEKLAEVLNLDEEELYQLAYENTRKIFKPTFHSISEIIEELENQSGTMETLIHECRTEPPVPLYVLTNPIKNWGAASVLYREQLQAFAEKLQTDLYLIPSSVHEMILTEADPDMLEMLESMVYDINQTVSMDERLSNEIYLYDRASNSITQVTDSPHKMLVEEAGEGMGIQMGM